MIKLEIIANKVLEEDIIEVLEAHGYGENFSSIYPVHGRGRHGWKEGSAIWPEENMIFIVHIENGESDAMLADFKEVKQKFAGEGFRIYRINASERLI